MVRINWSLILNVLLLMGAMVAIARMIVFRHQFMYRSEDLTVTPESGPSLDASDDIIAVRKIELAPAPAATKPIISAAHPPVKSTDSSLLIFLLAKDNRQLAGYELLQTILACGLRFGEGQLFHRHQNLNGQGPVLCSLATATATGVFDLNNMGGFSVHGLCLFMQTSGAATIDLERFNIMLDTAKQLGEGLNTHILDDQRKPWSQASEKRYLTRLEISPQVTS